MGAKVKGGTLDLGSMSRGVFCEVRSYPMLL